MGNRSLWLCLVICGILIVSLGCDSPIVSSTIQPCGWVWATEPLPNLNAEIQDVITSKELVSVTVNAYAYGENCFDPETGEKRYFAAMQTNLYVRLLLQDPVDAETAGRNLAGVLGVLAGYPPTTTPGPQPGTVTFTLLQESNEAIISLTWQQAMDLYSKGLQPEELWEALLAMKVN